MDLELVAIPGLGAFTTGRLARGDLQDLGGKTHWTLDKELLVLSTIDQVTRELLKALHVPARKSNANLVDLGRWDRCTRSVILLFTLSDVTHPDRM